MVSESQQELSEGGEIRQTRPQTGWHPAANCVNTRVNTPLSKRFRPAGTLRVLQGQLIAHGN
jgi:hypothetical protein